MRAYRHVFSLFAAVLLATACSSPDPAAEQAAIETDAADQDRELVENAIRRAYEAEGAEVTEIAMELSPDGSRYLGQASVRDPATGTEITVDCRYTTDVTGSPDLSCDRVTDAE